MYVFALRPGVVLCLPSRTLVRALVVTKFQKKAPSFGSCVAQSSFSLGLLALVDWIDFSVPGF